MDGLKDSRGNYTEAGLRHPNMKADLDLCRKYLSELGKIYWSKGKHSPEIPMSSIPIRPDNFDMQLSAALN